MLCPVCGVREDGEKGAACRLGKGSAYPLSEPALSPGGMQGVRAHGESQSFLKRRRPSDYQQRGAKMAPTGVSHRESAEAQFVHENCCIRFPDYFDFEKFWSFFDAVVTFLS